MTIRAIAVGAVLTLLAAGACGRSATDAEAPPAAPALSQSATDTTATAASGYYGTGHRDGTDSTQTVPES